VITIVILASGTSIIILSKQIITMHVKKYGKKYSLIYGNADWEYIESLIRM